MSAPPKPELWTRAALWIVLATAGLALTLGSRPGAPLGPLLYNTGPLACAALAVATLVVGVVQGLLHPPLVQPGRIRGVILLALVFCGATLPVPYPSSHEGTPSRVAFRLPFEDEWMVRWGGEGLSRSPLFMIPERRFGWEFIVVDGGGNTLRGATEDGGPAAGEASGNRWLAFGRRVLAPCPGMVVAVHGSDPDLGPRKGGQPQGNHIVLEVAEGEFLHLGGLKAGSLLVAAGDRVAMGDELARVGWSSSSRLSTDAHLQLHLTDSVVPGQGEGIPMRFHDYMEGEHHISAGIPTLRRGSQGRPVGARIRPSSILPH